MRWYPAIAVCMLSVAANAAPFPGPFTLSDGITLYLVNPTGASFDLTVRHHNARRASEPRPALVRVFDPQDNLMVRYEFPDDVVAPAPWEERVFPLESRGEGVYTVIVTGGGEVEVTTTPELEFGVYGHFQWLSGRDDQYADAYVYLPPGLDRLPIIADQHFESLVLSDEAGVERLHLEGDNRHGEVDLPAEGEHVWRLSARGAGDYRLDFKGYPIILCPSDEAARAIHASVDVMPDGTICYHQHQVAAWELLQEYRRRPAEDFEVDVVPLERYVDEFLREPARNQLLFGAYGVISNLTPVLAEQNLDPHSPWFGAIRVWKDAEGRPRADNPLADYHRLDLEAFAALNKILAALYWMDEPFNPYHRNPQLLNRIIVGALLDQMMLKEDERVIADNTYYFGIHAFSLCHSHSGAFSLVYRDVPAEVQRVWLAGQQRVTDRYLYGEVGGCTNQWAVLLDGLWRYCQGVPDDELRREAVLRNMRWLMSGVIGDHGQRAAGYMTEADGPDATYNGITGHYMAYIYNTSGDSEIRESLRRCYDLFNHTIAPEPEGAWLGSSGYCHRTPGDWTSPQYGAGLGPMARHLSEAGVRMPTHVPWAYANPVYDEASRAAAEERLRGMMRYFDEDHFDREAANTSRASGAFDIHFANWQTYSNEWLPAVLPCNEQESFTRNFGDEFFAVKRPTYYAFLYGGVAYGLWQAPRRPQEYTDQYPHNDGLCMFWSPEFGVSLLSQNWGASRANTLLADLGDGRIEWPWYWDTKREFYTNNATVTLSGKIHETPLSYERTYLFLDDRLECELTVTAEEAFTLERLSECLPYPLPEVKPGGLQVHLLDAQGKTLPNDSEAQALHFTNESGYGHLVVLAEPRTLSLGVEHTVDHYGNEREWGRALIALPTQWEAGQSLSLVYSLQSCAAEEVPGALR